VFIPIQFSNPELKSPKMKEILTRNYI